MQNLDKLVKSSASSSFGSLVVKLSCQIVNYYFSSHLLMIKSTLTVWLKCLHPWSAH